MNKQHLELQKRLSEVKLRKMNCSDTSNKQILNVDQIERQIEQNRICTVKRITEVNNIMYTDPMIHTTTMNKQHTHRMNDTYYMVTDIIFEIIIPDNWRYPYDIKVLSQTSDGMFKKIQIKFSSIPSEHIRTVKDNLYINLCVSYKTPKIITIKCPNKYGTVNGTIVSSVICSNRTIF